MAVYIQINKLTEADKSAVYEFGPVEGIAGRVLLDKSTGNVELLDLEPVYVGRDEFYLSRVSRALLRHHERGEYPGRTCYAA